MIDTSKREITTAPAAKLRQWTLSAVTQKFGFCPVDTWTPLVNLYQLEDRIEVCIDLAGVDPKRIDVRLEPGRLIVMGQRETPEPAREQGEGMRIIAMEIDHGQFCRTIALPENVDIRRADSEYKAGLLWVRLPLRARR
jgi:HSP20 family protein